MTSLFKAGSKNAAIFQSTAPYLNPYQGSAPRWLFVCSAGLLRSPTGATVAAKYGINARSAGSAVDYALVPLSVNLINWADKIVFVNEENYEDALDLFGHMQQIKHFLDTKSVVMDIPDNYDYMAPELVAFYEEKLFKGREVTLC